jgi:hypothetical protein
MTNKEFEKRMSDMETVLLKLMEEKPGILRQYWNRVKSGIIPFVLGVMVGSIMGQCLPPANRPQTVQAMSLLMSEPEARLTFSAMDHIASDIGKNAFSNTEAASSALRANTPKSVQAAVVESVQRFSDGTVEQYPAAMEQTRKRIMIRRQP